MAIVRGTCGCEDAPRVPSPAPLQGFEPPALVKDLGTIALAVVAVGGILWWYKSTMWAPVRRR